MREIIEFATARLRLRQWREADREPYAALNADSRVMEYFQAPLDRDASDKNLDSIREKFMLRGWGLWAVERRDTSAFIGFAGLSMPIRVLPCSPCVEIGWRLAQAHWGNGFASEAARAALRVGFARLALNEIVSFTALHNRRSRAVMERIGMRNSGEDFDYPGLPEGHPLRRHCLYRLRQADWLRLPAEAAPE